jgi:hypothetical protein
MNAQPLTPPRPAAWVAGIRFAVAVTLALAIPSLGLTQPITGTLVNALLFFAVATLGVGQAMMLGMITPLSAVLRGVLPLPLAIMIPFIALGNAALVSVYGALRARHRGLAVVAAAVCKFALLYAIVTLLNARPVAVAAGGAAQAVILPAALAEMMRWPQLATALAGGLLALGVHEGYRRLSR